MRKLMFLGLMLSLLLSALQASAVLYDFENPNQLNDWEIFGDAKWKIEKGVLVCEGKGGDGALVPVGSRQNQRVELKNVVFTDGTFEFKVKWIQGSFCEGGIYYRFNDIGNWYNVHLSFNAGANTRWMSMIDKNLVWKPVNLKAEKDIWVKFKVIVSGSQHQVFVDDKEFYNEKEDTIKSGKFVIGVWSSADDTFAVDDVKIEGKGIPGQAVIFTNEKLTTVWGNIRSE